MQFSFQEPHKPEMPGEAPTQVPKFEQTAQDQMQQLEVPYPCVQSMQWQYVPVLVCPPGAPNDAMGMPRATLMYVAYPYQAPVAEPHTQGELPEAAPAGPFSLAQPLAQPTWPNFGPPAEKVTVTKSRQGRPSATSSYVPRRPSIGASIRTSRHPRPHIFYSDHQKVIMRKFLCDNLGQRGLSQAQLEPVALEAGLTVVQVRAWLNRFYRDTRKPTLEKAKRWGVF